MARTKSAPVQRTSGRLPPHDHRAMTASVAVGAFSPFEEAFFRAGDEMSATACFGDLDDGYERPGLWRSLIALLTKR